MNEFRFYKNRKIFRKIDAILLAVGFFLCAATLLFLIPKTGATVEIYENGILYGSYSLNDYRVIDLAHCSVKIDENGVFMLESDCENQICVKSGAISSAHQTILCAPNRVVVIIRGESEVDAVTGGGA